MLKYSVQKRYGRGNFSRQRLRDQSTSGRIVSTELIKPSNTLNYDAFSKYYIRITLHVFLFIYLEQNLLFKKRSLILDLLDLV